MSILPQPTTFAHDFTLDAAFNLRTSEESRLFDGKILNQDDTHLFDNKGTGTGLFTNNTYQMSVGTGQYLVRQGKIYTNYFPGRSHKIDFSWIGFHVQAGVTKSIGYMSSDAVAPYTTNLDGIRLYNDGSTIRLQSWNYGTLTSDIPMNQWDNYAAVASYDWSNFGIGIIDFLWHGGKGYRFFLLTDSGYTLIHEYKHSGHYPTLIMRSPNHPLRYEIRSSSGTGFLTYVCGQISTEGSISYIGKAGSVDTGSPLIPLTTIGTTYPVLGIRKQVANRDAAIKIDSLVALVSTSDDVMWSVQRSPTLSAPLSYTAWPNSRVEAARGNGTITITSPGRIILSGPSTQGSQSPPGILVGELYSYLGMDIDNTPREIILCCTPISINVSVAASIIYKEF